MPATIRRAGFSWVELAVVLVIIGLLAAFGMPRYLRSVERQRAAAAIDYLSAVRASQEDYRSQNGVYARDVDALGLSPGVPSDFAVGAVAAGGTGSLDDSWTLTLTRADESIGYGGYTVVFTQDGFDAAKSTVAAMKGINPMEPSVFP